MSSRHNRSFRSVVALALACLYLLFAAGASTAFAHELPGNPCHRHDLSVSVVEAFADTHKMAAHGRSDSHATQNDKGVIGGHSDFACQFCSAIVSEAGPLAPRLIAIAAVFQDCGASFLGQPPTRLSRPPRSFIAL